MSDVSDQGSDIEAIINIDQLMQWKAKDLQKWCAEHKQKTSGSKNILAKRVYRSMNYFASDSSSGDNIESDDEDPKSLKDSFPTLWAGVTTDGIPPIRTEDVKNHFVYHKNPVGNSRMKFRRQLTKAKKLAAERYISDVEIGCDGSNETIFIRSKCKASMRSLNYNVTVGLFGETGMVQSGECSCKAGQSGVCAHVGALLLTLVNIKSACTSHICEWKAASDGGLKIEPQRCCDIRIYNPEKDVEEKIKPYPDVYQAGPKLDNNAFVDLLLDAMADCNDDCALYLTLRGKPGDILDFLVIYQVEFNFSDKVSLSSESVQETFSKFVSTLCATDAVLENLERSTRGQGVNPNWIKARAVILTASHMGSIVKRQKLEVDALVKTIMYPGSRPAVKSLAYGNKMEAKARREYARWHIKKCGKVIVEDRGLIVNSKLPFLGASIDGAVDCEKCGKGIVEIKCPYGDKKDKWRNLTPEECTNSSKFSCHMENGLLNLKNEHNYMYQVQGQMAVCGLEWVDFVIWTRKGMSVQRIHRDLTKWNDVMLPKLIKFYTTGVVAELYTSRLKRGLKLYM